MNTLKEIWKDVIGYEGYYQVSNFGRIKSLTRGHGEGGGKGNANKQTIRKGVRQHAGHLAVALWKNNEYKNCMVHRLVAQTFIPNPDSKPHINHIDNNPSNNHFENLEWCTPQENSAHMVKQGRSCSGSKNPMYEKTGKQNAKSKPVIDNSTGKTYESLRIAAKELNKNYSTLRNKLSGYKRNNTSLSYI